MPWHHLIFVSTYKNTKPISVVDFKSMLFDW
jgi:hypothetical protein